MKPLIMQLCSVQPPVTSSNFGPNILLSAQLLVWIGTVLYYTIWQSECSY
jgi:hypothetical protein